MPPSSFKRYYFGKDERPDGEDGMYSNNPIWDYFVHESHSGGTGVLFINQDRVKRVSLKTLTDESIVSAVAAVSTDPKYVALYNRYLDRSLKSYYEKELEDGVSLFRSYDPRGSNAFYISASLMDSFKTSGPPRYMKDFFQLIYNGSFPAYTFDPNIYPYDLSKGLGDDVAQSSIVETRDRTRYRVLSQNVALFFAENLILFWVFVVFVIIIGVKLFEKFITHHIRF